MPKERHIGLIAGGRDLPTYVAEAIRQRGERLTVVALDPDCPSDHFPDAPRFPLAKFGKLLKHLERAGVTHLCLAGHVGRPDFSTFRPDLSAMRYLPGTVQAARKGDDALMRHVLSIFESRGFEIVSAQSLCETLLLGAGPLGKIGLSADHRDDAQRAMEIAAMIGDADIGQAAVVANGIVLAVEAQEGTDAMLKRVASLPDTLRGSSAALRGVLAKRLKPGQDRRVDLPTLGPKTVELATQAGLAGIIAEEGEAFVIDRDRTRSLADAAGIFLVGLPRRQDHEPS